MQNNLKNPFSIQNVCQTLLNNGLLTNIQIKEISKKKDVAREKLERQRAQRLAASRSELKIVNPITIIDVIVSLELSRADKPSWPLDEEIIYQTLAKKWNLPYKKIDPLKLDLNLVTTTIPRSFAMKHLVLPIDMKDGSLTIATSNPFNMEVMEDLVRVTQMKIKTGHPDENQDGCQFKNRHYQVNRRVFRIQTLHRHGRGHVRHNRSRYRQPGTVC
jgi:general secretion pathway protein E